MKAQKKILILGAGITGLACARILEENRISYQIIDADSEIGGRIKTEVTTDGFRLDRGFQVLLSSYPELPNFLDLDQLQLQSFKSGALIYQDSSMHRLANPIVHPTQLFSTVFSNQISWQDRLTFFKLAPLILSKESEQPAAGIPTLDFLKQIGFTDSFISFFWQPFLAGIFLDKKLSLDAHYFVFLLRCFALGKATVPLNGMAEIPKNMARTLDKKNFLFSKTVLGVVQDDEKVIVNFTDNESIEADIVIQTFPSPTETQWRSVTTYYFTGAQTTDWKNWLVLVPPAPGKQINHLAVMSEVSINYAPPGQILIAANVIGDSVDTNSDDDGRKILAEMEAMAQKPLKLELLRKVAVQQALPIVKAALPGMAEVAIRNERPIYYCGDSLSNPSINFALKSGRMAALAVLKDNFDF